MSPEPYYRDEQVTLYLGNNLEVTDWLAADILVTDPPYGRFWKQGQLKKHPGHGTSTARPGIHGDEGTDARDIVLNLWEPRPAMVFGDLTLAPVNGTKITLVYHKPPDAGMRGTIGGFRRDAEAIYLLGPWPSGIGGRSSILETGSRMQGGTIGAASRYGHPHAKPVDVMETLISLCPPGIVADPFAGAGSTLIAARNLGRHAIGVELEEQYCEAAAKRLSQPVLDFNAADGAA